jgi:hypothetical protein
MRGGFSAGQTVFIAVDRPSAEPADARTLRALAEPSSQDQIVDELEAAREERALSRAADRLRASRCRRRKTGPSLISRRSIALRYRRCADPTAVGTNDRQQQTAGVETVGCIGLHQAANPRIDQPTSLPGRALYAPGTSERRVFFCCLM